MWDNDLRQMVFGKGWVVDDVVGHEYTHAVQYDEEIAGSVGVPGAVIESLADTFGEFIDLQNQLGNDDPSVKWMIGEDIVANGIRNMNNPNLKGHPDRVTVITSDQCVNFDTHVVAGVGNKAVSLIVDGGSHNGQSITGIGREKAEIIYYDALTRLQWGSGYFDLYKVLTDSCNDLVGTDGITITNCVDLEKALAAVEMYHIPCIYADIKANDNDGPITVSLTTPVRFVYTLDFAVPEGYGYADWWAAALYNNVYYYWDGDGWTTQATAFDDAYLVERLEPQELFNGSMYMPAGETYFFFAVDLTRDGAFNAPVRVDSVKVTAH